MKSLVKLILAASLLVLFVSATPNTAAQSGGTYEITWSTIDGGGGVQSGGAYTLTGTIGQPDAGALPSGVYTLAGGFWNAVSNIILGAEKLFLPLVTH